MKMMNYKLPVIASLFLLFALSFESCKKKGDELTVDQLTSDITAGDSALWHFPTRLFDSTSTCNEIPLLFLKTGVGNIYEYSQGADASCVKKGTFSITYTANRTGQDISLSLNNFYGDGHPLVLQLQYDTNSGVFYYLDPVAGLKPLVSVQMLAWKLAQNTTPMNGRIDFVSAELNGVVYFGMGTDATGANAYNDWYSFDGTKITDLSDRNAPYLYRARATVKDNKISIVGGQTFNYKQSIGQANMGSARIAGISSSPIPTSYFFGANDSTFVFDPNTKLWSRIIEKNNTKVEIPVQERNNAVYFTIGNQEVLALGNYNYSGVSNFYSRLDTSQLWNEFGITGNYGTGTSHAYEDALCFPWNGGYWIGGGVDSIDSPISYTNYVAFASSSGGAITVNPQSSNVNMLFPNGFSAGAGVPFGLNGGLGSLVFGVYDATSSTYLNNLYYVNTNGAFEKQLRVMGTSPLPGRSMVFWKLKDKLGRSRYFAGLGSGGSGLYELVVK